MNFIIYAVVAVFFVAVIIILGEKIVSIIIISYLRFILVSARVECSILIAGFFMHNYLSCVFLLRKVLRPLFATIRTICDYSRLFALFVLFAIRDYSLFAIPVFQTPVGGAEEVQVVGPTTDVCVDFVGVLVNEGTKSVGLISFP